MFFSVSVAVLFSFDNILAVLMYFFVFSVSCLYMQSPACDCVLAKVLDVVQSSLAEYETLTGRQSEDEASAAASPKSFSGYTMALLEAVAKMSVYVKEVVLMPTYVILPVVFSGKVEFVVTIELILCAG